MLEIILAFVVGYAIAVSTIIMLYKIAKKSVIEI